MGFLFIINGKEYIFIIHCLIPLASWVPITNKSKSDNLTYLACDEKSLTRLLACELIAVLARELSTWRAPEFDKISWTASS